MDYKRVTLTVRNQWALKQDELNVLQRIAAMTGIEIDVSDLPGTDCFTVQIGADFEQLQRRMSRGAGRKQKIIYGADGGPLTVGAVRDLLAKGFQAACIAEMYGVPETTFRRRWAQHENDPDDFCF